MEALKDLLIEDSILFDDIVDKLSDDNEMDWLEELQYQEDMRELISSAIDIITSLNISTISSFLNKFEFTSKLIVHVLGGQYE